MQINDLDLNNWKELDINVDSLWIIGERDKSGKHSNIYHGNFIPQIPNQLIRRYTKEKDWVLDLFIGSGTTLFECEKLNRNFIGFDINEKMIDYVHSKMDDNSSIRYDIKECDVVNSIEFESKMNDSLKKLHRNSVQFFIAHPPYFDIIKFTEKQEDLSQASDLETFLNQFLKAITNAYLYLDNKKYFSIVIGDIYKNGEVIPLSFYILDIIKKNLKVKLKGIIIKNIEGNRGKIGSEGIWRYRALKSDYFIFKHEYILVFKKEL